VTFQRARSSEAKQQREATILDAATRLAGRCGIRDITLTDIADEVGMHKSAMLRYFETREEIFLRLTAAGWQEWSPAVVEAVDALDPPGENAVAGVLAGTLVARPTFCDLLAHAPLNLERNVSVAGVRAFKLVTLAEVARIGDRLRAALPGLTESDAVLVIAAATSLSGALWQMATPGPELRELYRSEPAMAHAVVDVEPQVTRMLAAMIRGFLLPA